MTDPCGFGAFFLVVAGSTSGAELTDASQDIPEGVIRVWPDPIPRRWPPRIALSDDQLRYLSGVIDAFVNPPEAYPYIPGPPQGMVHHPRQRPHRSGQ